MRAEAALSAVTLSEDLCQQFPAASQLDLLPPCEDAPIILTDILHRVTLAEIMRSSEFLLDSYCWQQCFKMYHGVAYSAFWMEWHASCGRLEFNSSRIMQLNQVTGDSASLSRLHTLPAMLASARSNTSFRTKEISLQLRTTPFKRADLPIRTFASYMSLNPPSCLRRIRTLRRPSFL